MKTSTRFARIALAAAVPLVWIPGCAGTADAGGATAAPLAQARSLPTSSTTEAAAPVVEELALPVPRSGLEVCDLAWELTGYDDWAAAHGVTLKEPTGSRLVSWEPAGQNGNAVMCVSNGLMLTVLDATDQATADELVQQMQAIDDIFPDSETKASFAGTTGEYSYESDATGTYASLDLRHDLRMVSIALVAFSVTIDEASVKPLLEDLSGIALKIPLPDGSQQYGG